MRSVLLAANISQSDERARRKSEGWAARVGGCPNLDRQGRDPGRGPYAACLKPDSGGQKMRSKIRVALALVVLALLAGCAGKDFVRPNSDSFKLGRSTYSEVLGQMGAPRQTGEALQNEKTVKIVTYVYASTGGEPLEAGVTPARALSYYFHDDVLVGQEFLSSFKSDHSNFDDTKAASVVKGKTRRSEALAMLGKPTATFIYPMVKQTSGEAIGYSYASTRGGLFSGFKFFSKSLRIAFDEQDVVSEVVYSSSGNK